LPSAVWPFSVSTPIISNGTLRNLIFWPIGSSPGNRLSAIVLPITATFRMLRWSDELKKTPDSTCQSRITW
jgi:hypothetical protein